ncbi:Polygalacturonase [Filimonas lacunae]|uniref:Polygalacturonase n=1 Tax=Filimonas lacunae TaxID=477680 RepID=A0A173MIS7_9BACT|nr:glycoside hydrolase family 28 protein [Filimonas lacunae]BAV07321.1 polygalacturonase [Filimonas lacunae]SIS91391.1 Polygalacturonase [Filimonas lacunae]
MKKYLVVILLLFTGITLTAFIISSTQQRFLVTRYGAKGDSNTVNTQAIQTAINNCSAKGGGVVVIPKGVFLSGALFLQKGVHLQIEKGGVLKGTTNPNDYPQVHTRWEGEEQVFTAAFLNINDQEGTCIYGEGTIDGSGDEWVKQYHRQKQSATPFPKVGRPRLICFQNCSNVRISHLQLHNQAVWCLHILYSHNVTVNHINITAQHNIPSSDGIDIDSSDSVHISNTFIDVNDDCISIKSGKDEDGRRVNKPSRNIIIDSCHFAYGHGGVAMGSEVSGGIHNVLISNCVIDSDNWAPIRFKSQPSRGGVVENITYQNITLHNTRKAFEFNMAWRMVGTIRKPAEVPTIVRNILIKNVSGTVQSAGDMSGLDNSPIQNVTFENCYIKATTGLSLNHVTGIDTTGLHVTLP